MLKPPLVLILCLIAFSALAETPEEKGLAIAQESDRRDQGFGDFNVDLEMVLKNRHGEESRRKIRIATLEVKSRWRQGPFHLRPSGGCQRHGVAYF